MVQTGMWSRADRTDPYTLTAADGSPILLNPGRTFVELADVVDTALPGADAAPDG